MKYLFLQQLHISEISDTIAHLTTSSEFLSGPKSCCTNVVMDGSSRNIISHVPICLPSRECHLVPKFPVTPTHHMGNDYLACSAGNLLMGENFQIDWRLGRNNLFRVTLDLFERGEIFQSVTRRASLKIDDKSTIDSISCQF